MTIPKQIAQVIVSDPEILGGTPCFKGTRVPLATFLDYIKSGYSLERFLKGFSSVQREQAVAVLEWVTDETRRAVGIELAA